MLTCLLIIFLTKLIIDN